MNSVNPTVTLTDMGKLAWSDKEKAAGALARIPLKQFCGNNDNSIYLYRVYVPNLATQIVLPVKMKMRLFR